MRKSAHRMKKLVRWERSSFVGSSLNKPLFIQPILIHFHRESTPCGHQAGIISCSHSTGP